jgi:hypothetical protein
MKILSPTEEDSHLETTATILQCYISKRRDTLFKKLLKYWQTPLDAQVQLRLRLAAKWPSGHRVTAQLQLNKYYYYYYYYSQFTVLS